ncbi:flavin-containing monooxygenase [Nocardia huaxiensis]|uniref:flavin-containing monooxygenase n=1 Tax=Nocardia huaxiensis TaxID=2755382 RepID=UPI001E3CD461|nr:NAD(P)/FAD-dependent oxidoreductase [Nocardia huaxiensis]UFS96883.1 NAD(P)/FAD-dependent oxidoreductase [Nocardia huaxiensis]
MAVPTARMPVPRVVSRNGKSGPHRPDHEVIIVGAGLSGIGIAMRLMKAGIDDIRIIEKWDRPGGVWRANTYPGIAVDVPSMFYSFSYEPRNWSRFFPPGAEIQQYAEDLLDKYDLRRRTLFNTTIRAATWDEADHLWRATLDDGRELTARFAIACVGGLEVPRFPDIPGLDGFAGQKMHSARWDHGIDLRGKRVAVIGTGASALQLIPEVADTAAHLDVYQRTPIWVGPRPDFATPPWLHWLLDKDVPRLVIRAVGQSGIQLVQGAALPISGYISPALRVANAVGGLYYRAVLRDRELAAKLTPSYAIGCKRPSVSNRYLTTFKRPDVELVTDPIERATPAGLVTADGVERPIDVLICASGFHVLEKGYTPPFPITGRYGKDLGEFWDRHLFRSYQGVTIPHFPNAFMMPGPYNLILGSFITSIEAAAYHVARVITECHRRGATAAEVRREPTDRYTERCRAILGKTFLQSGNYCTGSNTYYVDYQGGSAVVRPTTSVDQYVRLRFSPHDDYSYRTLARVPGARPGRFETHGVTS